MVRVGCHAETIKRKVVAGIQKSGKTPEESFDSFDIDVDGLINHLELQKGHTFEGYNSTAYYLCYIISVDRRNRLLLWEQEVGSSNLSTPTL